MTSLIKTILIVDDNRELYKELKDKFNINNIDIKFINNIEYLKKNLDNDYLCLIIIDVDKLLVNSIDVLKYIRTDNNVPIIFISSLDAIFDKVLAFNMGVDDYIVKPFDFRELVVRAKAIIRRYHIEEKNIKNSIIKFDNLIIDISSYNFI